MCSQSLHVYLQAKRFAFQIKCCREKSHPWLEEDCSRRLRELVWVDGLKECKIKKVTCETAKKESYLLVDDSMAVSFNSGFHFKSSSFDDILLIFNMVSISIPSDRLHNVSHTIPISPLQSSPKSDDIQITLQTTTAK